MREIKFRLVCKDMSERIFYEFVSLQDLIFGKYNVEVIGMIQEIIGKDEFTGLLDKNEKEIYEGDIVKREICSRDDPAHGFYGINYIVKWCDREAGFNLYEVDTGNFQFGAVNFDVEIIGNIWENPEMVEKKKDG